MKTINEADEILVETPEETIEEISEPETQESEEILPRDRVVLADGTMLECTAGHDDDRTIWFWFNKEPHYALSDLFMIFTNSDKTRVIKSYFRDKLLAEWEGYTKLFSITARENGRIDIGMRQP